MMVFRPVDLMCDHAVNPIGIDDLNPDFSWRVFSEQPGFIQGAYRIEVYNVTNGGNVPVWDSGKVYSSDCSGIEYKGAELKSREVYCWRVTVWDCGGGPGASSDFSFFEMGLLSADEWKGVWIGLPFAHVARAYIARRSFALDKKVERARVYICGLGYYELWINGKKIGDHVLDPGNTDYSKRALYVCYDVKNALVKGENVIAVHIGKGWYANPSVILQMELDLKDGEHLVIYTEPLKWDVMLSPVIDGRIYQGETYDARLEYENWCTADEHFNESTGRKLWQLNVSKEYDLVGNKRIWNRYPAILLPPPGGVLRAQQVEPIKVMEEIPVKEINNPAEGIYVFDFGQNFSGWARLRVKGPAGTMVTLKYSELLHENGLVNMDYLGIAENTRKMQTDCYILKGEGIEEYSPKFTYHGFRYVQIEGFPGIPDENALTGCVVHTSVGRTGHFTCSNEILNGIHKCVLWSERSNLYSIMTDCPQRDERQGWLNDLTARAEEAVYNYNMARMFRKVVRDIQDAQDPFTGSIADTAPFRRAQNPADPVSSSYLLLPWLSYLFYGRKKVLEESYEGLKRWTNYLYDMTEDGVVIYSYWGDWASPVGECFENAPQSKNTPGHLVSTAFLHYNLKLMQKIATVLGKPDDAGLFKARAERTRESFNKKYFNGDTNNYASGTQGSNAIALYAGLADEDRACKVAGNIAKDVMEKHNGHLTTGNICTKYLLEVLTIYGFVDVAYTIATQTTYPSWGYMLSKGATTIWERWEYSTGAGMNSHNHAMYGSIDAWFYKYLSGLVPDEEMPGFRRVLIKPYIPTGLDSVEASLDTIRGKVKSGWMKTGKGLDMFIEIPPNSEGKVYVPAIKDAGEICVSVNGETVWAAGSPAGKKLNGISLSAEQVVLALGPGEYNISVS